MHSVSSAPAARQVSRSPSGVPASAMAWTVGGGKGARALRSLRRALVQEVSGENEMLDLLNVVLRDDLGLPLPQHQFDVPTAREVVMDRLEQLMGLGPGPSHGGQEHGGQAAQHPQGLQTWHDGQAAQHPQQHQQGPPTWQQEQQGSWQQGQQWPWSRTGLAGRIAQLAGCAAAAPPPRAAGAPELARRPGRTGSAAAAPAAVESQEVQCLQQADILGCAFWRLQQPTLPR